MFQLRDYQQSFRTDVYDCFGQGLNRVIGVAGCGYGKTAIGAVMATDSLSRGCRTWFVAHLDLLIDQTYDSFVEKMSLLGVPPNQIGCIHRNHPANYVRPIQVVALKTAKNLIESGQINDEDLPSFLMVDECHTTRFQSPCQYIVEKARPRFELGLTGTPVRLDSAQSFGEYYDAVVNAPSVKEITQRGYLSPMRFLERYDAEQVSLLAQSGFDDEEIKTVYDTPESIKHALDLWETECGAQKSIWFCCDVQHAKNVAKYARKRGYSAESIDYKTPRGRKNDTYPEKKTRYAILRGLKEGKIQLLAGRDVLSIGFDEPSVVVGVQFRPTESLALHVQQLGRPRRVSPETGKTYGLILDLVGNCANHSFNYRIENYDPEHGYGEGEWNAEAILAGAKEKDEDTVNPFAVDCQNPSCDALISYQVKICPQCGHEQIREEKEPPQARDFSSKVIETVRPSALDSNSPAHAQHYYRFLLARSVLSLRSLPGKAWVMFSGSSFGKFASLIPRGRSEWTLGAIFNAPDSQEHIAQYYGFLSGKYAHREISEADKNRKIWSAIEQEFHHDTVVTFRQRLGKGDLFAEQIAQAPAAPVRIGRTVAPVF